MIIIAYIITVSIRIYYYKDSKLSEGNFSLSRFGSLLNWQKWLKRFNEIKKHSRYQRLTLDPHKHLRWRAFKK